MLVNATTDALGRTEVTFPEEAGRATLLIVPGDLPGSSDLVEIEWEPGFRPDRVEAVARVTKDDASLQFRLTDSAGRSAVLAGPVDPTTADGRLAVRIALPNADSSMFGALSGTVVDEADRPIVGASVTLLIQDGTSLSADAHSQVTDEQGRYQFSRVARCGAEGQLKYSVVAKKPGCGGGVPPGRVKLAEGDAMTIIESIRLASGVAARGMVVDADDRPVAGAWIEVDGFRDGQIVTTDPTGRFTLSNLARGVQSVTVQTGDQARQRRFVADGGTDHWVIRLVPSKVADPIPVNVAKVEAAKISRLATDWQVTAWTDGQDRHMADFRGRVIVLDFWGIWCGPCIRQLPSLESLYRQYRTREVVFLGIHSAGDDVVQVRKYLNLKGVTFPSGIDRGELNSVGPTTQNYSVGGYPTTIVIDSTGKIAFSTDSPEAQGKLEAIAREHSLEPEAMTSDQYERMAEVRLRREIERLTVSLP